ATPLAKRMCEEPSAEHPRQVVIEDEPHQKNHQQDSELLSESQGPIRQRRALDPLRELENDLAAVEYRHGEQVQDAEADADDGEKAQERAEARLRAVPRIAGDGYRSRNITHRD